VPNFINICQSVAEIHRFKGFENGARRHLGFLKFEVFNGWGGYEPYFASSYQISYRSVKPLRRYCDFCDFQDNGGRHLKFLKIRNFNGWSAVRVQCASPCQISSKSVADIWRFTRFFKMAAVRHLEFAGHVLGLPTMSSWWSLSLCKIWLKSVL